MADVRFDDSGGAPSYSYQPRPGVGRPGMPGMVGGMAGQYGQYNRFQPQSTSAMVRMVIKTGLARDEKSANKVLLICSVIFFSTSLILFARLLF